jgi:hypothetical protein
VQEVIKLVRLGHRIEGGQGNLLHWNCGSQLKLQGLSSLFHLLPIIDLPADDLLDIAAELREYQANAEGLQDAYRWEYGVRHRQVDRLCAGVLEPMELGIMVGRLADGDDDWQARQLFDPDHTKSVMAEGIRLAIRGLRDHQPGTLPGLFHQLAQLRDRIANTGRNPVGVQFCTRALSEGILVPLRQVGKENTHLAAMRTLVALKAWQVRHGGKLPGRLAELVPDYLDHVPIDPFDGRPLRYSKTKRIVYSVGQDQKDAGGSTMTNMVRARVDDNEPTFRIGS